MNTSTLDEIWERLRGVLTLRFTSSSRIGHPLRGEHPWGVAHPLLIEEPTKPHNLSVAPPHKTHSHTGWQGVGTGIVDVSHESPCALIFREIGMWRQVGGREHRFTNTFRWSRLENRLHLAHLRQGSTRPVFLLEMTPTPAGLWCETAPHPCRADYYRASLQVEGQQVRVNWRINGPRKDESVDYVYL